LRGKAIETTIQCQNFERRTKPPLQPIKEARVQYLDGNPGD
jgi:hypothetical protein